MFTTKNIHYLLALFILCNIVNVVVILLLKSNILSFINKIFNSQHNKDLNWYADSKLLFKSLAMMSIYFIIVVLILVQYTPSVAKCLNHLKYLVRNNGIVDFNKIPLSLYGCIGTAYLIFGITMISCTKVNIVEAMQNMDIRGVGASVENFVAGKREGYSSYSYDTNYKNLDGNYMNNHRNIRYNNKLSKYIENIGSIFFGVGLESKPECCNSNQYTSSGCLCVNKDNIKNLQQRGGNHNLGETFLNSFVDLNRTMIDAETTDRISTENSFVPDDQVRKTSKGYVSSVPEELEDNDSKYVVSGSAAARDIETQSAKASRELLAKGIKMKGFNTSSAPDSWDMETTHGHRNSTEIPDEVEWDSVPDRFVKKNI